MLRNIYSHLRQIVRLLVLNLKNKVTRSPKLKRIVFILLKPFPKLTVRLKRVGQAGFNPIANQTQPPQELRDLSPRAKQIYVQLKQAIENQKNKS